VYKYDSYLLFTLTSIVIIYCSLYER